MNGIPSAMADGKTGTLPGREIKQTMHFLLIYFTCGDLKFLFTCSNKSPDYFIFPHLLQTHSQRERYLPLIIETISDSLGLIKISKTLQK